MPNPAEITLDPQRLAALAAIARRSRATLSGVNDALHNLRDAKHDLARRLDLARATAAQSYAARQMIGTDGLPKGQTAGAFIAALEAQMADLAADLVVREVEQAEASDAYSAARANLKAAIAHAEASGLPMPTGIKEAA